jgi:hypothetical protein
VVRKELFDEGRDRGKVFGKPRIFDNMLSSQPLCFNLFGELSLDLDAATDVARILWPDRVDMIRSIKFEHSPGRGDANYLSNKSAFDVYLEHSTPTGGRGFIGIEVKYHENLRAAPARHKPRYDEVAAASGAFKPGRTEGMHKPPLQQLWLDHLLALSMLQGRDWDTGLFVLLHPTHNEVCSSAWRDYSTRLRPESHAQARTIEELVGVISKVAPRPWVTEFEHRYLDFPRVHEFGL